MLKVKSIDKADKYNKQFQRIGYEAKGEHGIKGRRSFQKVTMKKAKIVVCKNCGATFRNRRFWALPKNDPSPRKHCVRCWSKGPFEEATKEDIVAFSTKLTHNLNIFGILEIISGLILIAVTIYGIFK